MGYAACPQPDLSDEWYQKVDNWAFTKVEVLMSNDVTDELKPAINEFLMRAAQEFLSIPVTRLPDFEVAGHSSTAKIYIADVPEVVTEYFRHIMADEPDRFASLNREFHENQPGLQGAGWVITRFAGYLYLSLSMEKEIYVKRVPRTLSTTAVAVAKSFGRFLDGTVGADDHSREPWSMTLALASSLQGSAGTNVVNTTEGALRVN